MERCGKCGMVEESSIHDINSPDTEIRRVAHHFELVAPCPRCAIKDAALAAANAEKDFWKSHDKDADIVRDSYNKAIEESDLIRADLAIAKAELTRLREAIGWAESHAQIYATVGGYRYVDFASELRRRAGGEGEGGMMWWCCSADYPDHDENCKGGEGRMTSDLTCEDCGRELQFGVDGVCRCGKQLCFDCHEKNHKRCYEIPVPGVKVPVGE